MARKRVETADELMEDDQLNPDSGIVEDPDNEDVMTIDLDDIDESAATFQPLPRGVYDAYIETLELTTSQAGNKMIAVRFRIIGGDYDKRLVFDHYVLNNEIGKARLKTFLTVLGFASGGAFNLNEFVNSDEAIGTKCRLKLGVRMQQGEKRQQIQEIMPSADEDPFFG